MARAIKKGQSIYIPFVNGESVFDSQNRPRMYKTVEQFQKTYPGWREGNPDELVEYVPVVHGKWLEIEEIYGDIRWKCSACGIEWCFIEGTPEENGTHYCPNCGAKMDLD